MASPLSPPSTSERASPQVGERRASASFGRVLAQAQRVPHRTDGSQVLTAQVPGRPALPPLRVPVTSSLPGAGSAHLLSSRLAGGHLTRVAPASGGGPIPETLRLHRLQVGWQQEARTEGLLGAIERVLERGVSLERWDRTRQESLREPRLTESPGASPSIPPPPLPEAATGSEGRGRLEVQGMHVGGGSAPAPGQALAPAPRSRELMALVERIEACVRQGRPALSLELSGTGWKVDLERHALGGVVLRLQTPRHGRAPDLEALRDELHARGVIVRELSCGSRSAENHSLPEGR